MRSKWLWMSRIQDKLSVADISVFDVVMYFPESINIAQRIWVLNRYIGAMKDRPEFNK